MKRCSKCKIEKEVSEFHRNKSTKDGLQDYCKPCISGVGKKWRADHNYYENHKEHKRKVARKWYGDNKERHHKSTGQWKRNNRPKVNASERKRRKRVQAECPEQIRAKKRRHYLRRREHILAKLKENRQRNPESRRTRKRELYHLHKIPRVQDMKVVLRAGLKRLAKLVSAQFKLWKQDDRERRTVERRLRSMMRRLLSRDRANERQRQRRATDPERYKTQRHELYLRNREKSHTQSSVWRQVNPEKSRQNVRRRRALQWNAPINDLTDAEWLAILKAFKWRCAYCGKRLTLATATPDHITPYVKGGSNTLTNVVPCCRSCNSRKQAGPPLCPVQPLLLIP